MALSYESIKDLTDEAEASSLRISELVLRDEVLAMEDTRASIYSRMEESFDIMCESVRQGKRPHQRSMSGLTGGEGHAMEQYALSSGGLSGPFLTGAMARALSASAHNASMGRIVATPTAGSCGILPGCLVSLYEEKRAEKEDVIMSLFTAAAFGMVIASRAGISGAEGGCQAECGSAAGMAAAALVELQGGSPAQCADALAIAIVNQMGLVCDPVAGLVEIPCIKRNAAGTMIAFSAADMALAGIKAYIPADECIDAMREVGNALPHALKETALGGLATTPTGLKLKEQVFGH